MLFGGPLVGRGTSCPPRCLPRFRLPAYRHLRRCRGDRGTTIASGFAQASRREVTFVRYSGLPPPQYLRTDEPLERASANVAQGASPEVFSCRQPKGSDL